MKVVDNTPNEKKVIQKQETLQEKSESFFEIDDLPSRNYFYPEGVVIEGRRLKVLEAKKLASINEVNYNSVINDVLRRCIRGIDINDLLVEDKLFLIFWLRANTYRSSGYEIDFECPLCGGKSSYHFELDKLNVKYLKEDFSDDDLVLTLPESGDVIKYNFLRVRDEKKSEQFKKQFGNIVSDLDSDLVDVTQLIDTINDEKLKPVDVYNYLIEELNPDDFSYLLSYIKEKGCGVENYVTVDCPHCGGAPDIGVVFLGDFFLPEYRFR